MEGCETGGMEPECAVNNDSDFSGVQEHDLEVEYKAKIHSLELTQADQQRSIALLRAQLSAIAAKDADKITQADHQRALALLRTQLSGIATAKDADNERIASCDAVNPHRRVLTERSTNSRRSSVSANELKGTCAQCQQPVLGSQLRCKATDGRYMHRECSDLSTSENEEKFTGGSSKGSCLICAQPVLTNQDRVKDSEAGYMHTACHTRVCRRGSDPGHSSLCKDTTDGEAVSLNGAGTSLTSVAA